MKEGRGLGGKLVNRLVSYFSNKQFYDLKKLATACNMKPAELNREIITRVMYDSQFITELQNDYCTQAAYRVRIIQKDRIPRYELAGRDDL